MACLHSLLSARLASGRRKYAKYACDAVMLLNAPKELLKLGPKLPPSHPIALQKAPSTDELPSRPTRVLSFLDLTGSPHPLRSFDPSRPTRSPPVGRFRPSSLLPLHPPLQKTIRISLAPCPPTLLLQGTPVCLLQPQRRRPTRPRSARQPPASEGQPSALLPRRPRLHRPVPSQVRAETSLPTRPRSGAHRA